jgi:hypothetical protein
MRKSVLNRASIFLLGVLSAAASFIAIIAYKSPLSLPVISGILVSVCALDEPVDLAAQNRFFSALMKNDGRVVYVKDLEIIHGCVDALDGRRLSAKEKKELFNEYMVYDPTSFPIKDGVIVGDTVTVFFPKNNIEHEKFGGLILLTVNRPNKETLFSASDCDEHCFGARGVYKIALSAAEGIVEFKITPFPATAAVFDAYQCTLDKLNASGFLERIFACRF